MGWESAPVEGSVASGPDHARWPHFATGLVAQFQPLVMLRPLGRIIADKSHPAAANFPPPPTSGFLCSEPAKNRRPTLPGAIRSTARRARASTQAQPTANAIRARCDHAVDPVATSARESLAEPSRLEHGAVRRTQTDPHFPARSSRTGSGRRLDELQSQRQRSFRGR